MYNGLLQIHPMHAQTMVSDVKLVVVGHLGTRRLNVPQNCLKVPRVCPKVPRKYLKVPPLFSGTVTSSNSQLQALATGICSIQILILGRSTLSSDT